MRMNLELFEILLVRNVFKAVLIVPCSIEIGDGARLR